MILGITGHRPHPHLGGYNIPNPTYDAVREAIRDKFEELKPEKIISGMATGTDQWAAEIAIELGIPFIAALPCQNQDAKWPPKGREVFKEILAKAEEVVLVHDGPYTSDCMHKRDQWVVDNSSALLAVWNGQRYGGTFATVRMAEKGINKGREYEIHRINPEDLLSE